MSIFLIITLFQLVNSFLLLNNYNSLEATLMLPFDKKLLVAGIFSPYNPKQIKDACSILGEDQPFICRNKFMSDKIVELEVKIAFLEQSITELSDVLYSQQQQIDLLKNDQHRMQTHLQALDKDDQQTIDDQPPPHY